MTIYRAKEIVPTEKGIKNYPPDGYYDEFPCTCEYNCPFACKGKCGCEACHYAYADFLSSRED